MELPKIEGNKLDMVVINFEHYSGRDALYNLIQATSYDDVVDALISYYEVGKSTYVIRTENNSILISADKILVVNR